MKSSIKTYSQSDLEKLVVSAGQPKFRVKQIIEWLYRHEVQSYEEMTNVPLALRNQLAEAGEITTLKCVDKRVSQDGSRKYVYQLFDGAQIEAVALPSLTDNAHLSVCFSTQVGCPMQCAFCATGHEGFTRNLGMGEIIDQILAVQKDMGQRVSHLVAMGQGEPFLNYDNVMEALRVLNNPKGIAIGARHITVSTCGYIPGIERFSREPEQFTLAISLHSARQNVRNDLMPAVKPFPLGKLKEALLAYVERTNRRVTLEYIMIQGVNDRSEDLKALIQFTRGLLCHVNFIGVNPTTTFPYQASSAQTMNEWVKSLEAAHVQATIRASRGSDIQGACGQLKNALGGNKRI